MRVGEWIRKNKFNILLDLSFCVFIVLAFFYWQKIVWKGVQNPDHWYHVQISKQISESGPILRTLPQFEDIGWANYFPEKEFLFHQLTALGYRLGGEKGVALTAHIIGIGVLFLIYGFLRIFASPLSSFLAVGTGALLSFDAMSRFATLRPHVLALFWFVALIISLRLKRERLAGVICALYALSYHTLYMPMAVAFIYYISESVSIGKSSREAAKIFGICAVGMLVGILAHPYFPANLEAVWKHALIATMTTPPSDIEGGEVFPLSTQQLLLRFGFYAVFVIGFYLLPKQKSRAEHGEQNESPFLLGVVFLCWLLALISPRALEYAVPANLLLMAEFFRREPKRFRWVLMAAAIFQAPSLWIAKKSDSLYSRADYWHDLILPSLNQVSERGAKVFTCNWGIGAYVFHMRPDLRMVDVLDANYIYFYDRAKYFSRDALVNGSVVDTHAEIKNIFKADYVLCEYPKLIEQLRNDPDFEDLTPPGAYRIFRLRAERGKNWVRELNLLPTTAQANPIEMVAKQTVYFNWKPEMQNANDVDCKNVDVPRSEIKHNTGATWIGVGGGPNISIWHNQKELFRTAKAFDSPRALAQWVPLQQELRADDLIRIRVCARNSDPFFGLTISLWNEGEIASKCSDFAKKQQWQYSNSAIICGAPIAQPVLR